MPNIAETDWIGQKDYHGRELLYWQKIKTDSFYEPKLAVVLNPKGHLELMVVRYLVEVIHSKKISLVFQGGRSIGFTFKGGGKIYFSNNESSRYDVKFKMDYDDHGNLFTRMIQHDREHTSVNFLSRLWISIIKRRQQEIRKRRKEAR